MKTSTMKLWLTTALTLLMTPMFGQLSGTYTINASGSGTSNYTSFGAAVTALSTSGVSGAVTFNVASGTYTEQVTIPAITGASATNTITFQADPANTTAATLTNAATSSSANWTLRLDGTSYVTLKGLTIQATGSSYARVIDQYGANTSISLIDNTIDGNAGTSTSSYFAGLYYSYSSTTEAKGNWTVTGNTFTDVSYAAYIYGKSYTTSMDTCVFDNNTVTSTYYGFYIRYAKYQHIHGNTITNTGTSTYSGYNYAYYASVGCDVQNNTMTNCRYGVYAYSGAPSGTAKPVNVISNNTIDAKYYGIYVSGSSSTSSTQQGQTTIQKNSITLNGTSSVYGVYVQYLHSGSTERSLVENNMISLTNTSSAYGIYPYHCQNTDIQHNSIRINGGSTTSGRGLYINKSTSSWTASVDSGMVIKNNIFANYGGGLAFEASGAATPGNYYTADNNVYHSTGTNPFEYNNTGYATLSAWQTATSQDAASVNSDPLFTSTTDLHCQGTAANNAGAALGVTTDFDGDTRSTTTPDIGADEYAPLTCFLVSGVGGSNLSNTSFDVTWTSPNSSPLSYEVRYRASGATAYTSNGASASISGLTAATTYEVSVREICAAGDTAAWTADASITTLVCAASDQCQYMIYMTDSYGDGWNGNSVNVAQGGVTVGTFGSSFTSGSSATDSISLCDLSSASFTLNLGSWSNEIGFNIVSAGGDTVLTHAATSGLTNGYSFGSFTPVCGSCGISTAMPYMEDFNSWGSSSNDTCWSFAGPVPFWDWTSGGTPSSFTGPSSSSGMFLFLETSYGSTGGEATAELPVMSFSDSSVNLSFDYHMYGATMGTLHIEYHDGSAWVIADTIVGQQQANQTDPWLSHSMTVPAGGLTRLRFRGTRGSSYTGDMSVDNLVIQPDGCLMPTSVSGTNPTMTSLDASWNTFNGTPLSYEVRYRAAGTSAWTSNGAATAITGLTGATTYEISVREICSAGDTSLWSAAGTGTTLVCNPTDQCDYYVFMTDSYGDGWNGNSINFKQSGATVAVAGVGFTGGSAMTDTIGLCSEDSATVDLNIGSWTSEVGFDVVSSVTGDTVLSHASGSNLTAGQVFGTFYADCRTPATYHVAVDMRQQTVSSNGVHIAGSFQGWNPSATAMTDADGDGIYEYTINAFLGDNIEYKFINGNAWGDDEGVPGACQYNGSWNRGDSLANVADTAATVCFGECGPCTIDVTFRVNMEWEVTNSSLADTVHVAGSMQGWNPATSAMDDSDGDGVWEWTTSIDVGGEVWYKFINGNSWGEAEASGDLSGCGQDDGFGGYNRYDSLGVADTVLPIVCFTKCHNCAVSLDEFAADVYVFPNPSNGAFTLERSNLVGTLEVAVMNAQGQLIAVDTWNDGNARHDMDLSTAPAGVYMIRLSSENGNRTMRVTIQR